MLHFVLHLAENVLHFTKNIILKRKVIKPKTPVNIGINDKYWGFIITMLIGFDSRLLHYKSLVFTRLFIFCVAFRVAFVQNEH